jgi:hypothetical protein
MMWLYTSLALPGLAETYGKRRKKMKQCLNNIPANWVTAGMLTLRSDGAGFAPAPYQSYVRIFHSLSVKGRPMERWAQVAEHAGKQISATTQWTQISSDPSGVKWGTSPRRGSLSANEARILSRILCLFTNTPETCYFGLWEGWNGAELPTNISRFLAATREMGLFEGPVTDASNSFQDSPRERLANLWWPADHAWFVTSDIDFDSTIVSATRECADEILNCSELETIEIHAQDNIGGLLHG